MVDHLDVRITRGTAFGNPWRMPRDAPDHPWRSRVVDAHREWLGRRSVPADAMELEHFRRAPSDACGDDVRAALQRLMESRRGRGPLRLRCSHRCERGAACHGLALAELAEELQQADRATGQDGQDGHDAADRGDDMAPETTPMAGELRAGDITCLPCDPQGPSDGTSLPASPVSDGAGSDVAAHSDADGA